MSRPISTIAAEIEKDWGGKVNYAARPYLAAMHSLTTIKSTYGADSAKSVLLYFLSNASSWKGETAKRVKEEIRTLCKGG